MTSDDLAKATGISGVRHISEHTVVVEFLSGHCRPATDPEVRMWDLLRLLTREQRTP